MKAFRGLLGLMILPLIVAFSSPPPLPSSFYGSVTIEGWPAPVDTPVEAYIDGQLVAQTKVLLFEGQSVFALDVPGDIGDTETVEGGTTGDPVIFTVAGRAATPAGEWRSGTNQRLDLNSGLIVRRLFLPLMKR